MFSLIWCGRVGKNRQNKSVQSNHSTILKCPDDIFLIALKGQEGKQKL